MNRRERRNIAKQYGTSVANKQYRDGIYEDGVNKGIHNAIGMILYMTAYNINYKLGFGRKRLLWIMNSIVQSIDAYNTGHLTPEDFAEIKNQVKKLGFSLD